MGQWDSNAVAVCEEGSQVMKTTLPGHSEEIAYHMICRRKVERGGDGTDLKVASTLIAFHILLISLGREIRMDLHMVTGWNSCKHVYFMFYFILVNDWKLFL